MEIELYIFHCLVKIRNRTTENSVSRTVCNTLVIMLFLPSLVYAKLLWIITQRYPDGSSPN